MTFYKICYASIDFRRFSAGFWWHFVGISRNCSKILSNFDILEKTVFRNLENWYSSKKIFSNNIIPSKKIIPRLFGIRILPADLIHNAGGSPFGEVDRTRLLARQDPCNFRVATRTPNPLGSKNSKIYVVSPTPIIQRFNLQIRWDYRKCIPLG